MKKKAVALFALTILGTILFLWLIKAPLVGAYLTDKMRIPVIVGSINLSPSQANIRRFSITNPHGFRIPNAFHSDQIQINYDYKKLLTTPVEIDAIYVSDNFISVEFSNFFGAQNNWKVIGSRMPKRTWHAKEVLIHKLILLNTKVEIRGLGLSNAVTVKQIDRMVFSEIDSRDGFPTSQLVQQIFQSSGIQEYIQDTFTAPQEVVPKNYFKWFGK